MATKLNYNYNRKGRITSPVGTFFYPFVFKPATYQGNITNFEIKVVFDDNQEFLNELENLCNEEFEAFLEANPTLKKPNRGVLNIPITEGNSGALEGKTFVKFKNSFSYTYKGQTIERKIPVFDGAKGKVSSNVIIGNGSKGKIAFSLRPYFVSSANFGVQLILDAVQVLELVEYTGGTNNDFGFEEEENAFVAPTVEDTADDSDF